MDKTCVMETGRALVYMNSVAIAGVEPTLGAGLVEEKGEGSPSQARIFHRLAFSAKDCPQSIQSRLQKASRRKEDAPLRPSFLCDLQRPPAWKSSVVLDRGGRGCLL